MRTHQRSSWQWRTWLAGALALALVFGSTAQPADALAYDSTKINSGFLQKVLDAPTATYEVIVRTGPGDPSDRLSRIRSAVENNGGTAKFPLGIVGGIAARMTGSKLLDITLLGSVDFIYQDVTFHSQFDPAADGASATTPGVLAVNAPRVWTELGATGQGIGIAVVDSGVDPHADLAGRIAASIDFTTADPVVTAGPGSDPGGHGTHVAGLIAGDGTSSGGAYTGIAPNATIIDVRVIAANGVTNTSTVLRGLQWVLANRDTYGIRVVNLSLGRPQASSYKTDAIATATEILTFAGITVVVSAGNAGSATQTISSPASDPYVIAVGAADDIATADRADDTIWEHSSRGRTKYDDLMRPDVVAPGRKMVSLRAPGSTLDTENPDRRVTAPGASGADYFRLSGTSMAAPVVAGTVALMLDADPTLTPRQIKERLRSSAVEIAGFAPRDQGKGMIDAYAAVTSTATPPYQSKRVTDAFAEDFRSFLQGQPFVWESLTYNGGVDSNNVSWENVTWENVTWDNATWENATWEAFTWENATWENATWENATWENATWENATWENATWENATWE